MNTTIIPDDIPWQDLPGYKKILKAVLIEMKEREIASYPDALIECTNSLLFNSQILSCFTIILFTKTKYFSLSSLMLSVLMIAVLSSLLLNYSAPGFIQMPKTPDPFHPILISLSSLEVETTCKLNLKELIL